MRSGDNARLRKRMRHSTADSVGVGSLAELDGTIIEQSTIGGATARWGRSPFALPGLSVAACTAGKKKAAKIFVVEGPACATNRGPRAGYSTHLIQYRNVT